MLFLVFMMYPIILWLLFNATLIITSLLIRNLVQCVLLWLTATNATILLIVLTVPMVILLMTPVPVKPALRIVLRALTKPALDVSHVPPVMKNKVVHVWTLHVLLPIALASDNSFCLAKAASTVLAHAALIYAAAVLLMDGLAISVSISQALVMSARTSVV